MKTIRGWTVLTALCVLLSVAGTSRVYGEKGGGFAPAPGGTKKQVAEMKQFSVKQHTGQDVSKTPKPPSTPPVPRKIQPTGVGPRGQQPGALIPAIRPDTPRVAIPRLVKPDIKLDTDHPTLVGERGKELPDMPRLTPGPGESADSETGTPGGKEPPATVPGAHVQPSKDRLRAAFGEPVLPDLGAKVDSEAGPAVQVDPERALGAQLAEEMEMGGGGKLRAITEEERGKLVASFQEVMAIFNSMGGRGDLHDQLSSSSDGIPDISTKLSSDPDDVLDMPESDLPSLPGMDDDAGEDEGDEGMSLTVDRPGSGVGGGSSGSGGWDPDHETGGGDRRSWIASCGGGATASTHVFNKPDGSGHKTTTYEDRNGRTSVQVLKTGGKATRVIVTTEDKNSGKKHQTSFAVDKNGKTSPEPEPELAEITEEDPDGTVERVEPEQERPRIQMSLEEAIAGLQASVVDSNVIMPNPEDEGEDEGRGEGGVILTDQSQGIKQPSGLDGGGGLVGPSRESQEGLDRDRPGPTPEPIDPLGPGEDHME